MVEKVSDRWLYSCSHPLIGLFPNSALIKYRKPSEISIERGRREI
jgi:hypothetical protein